ncbi:MAG: hypothetical protein U0M42_07280, partial [Acutalibacteraceae bacterium]|nr:hypothetical protein [Acutalibacteraceae bacterium]
MKRFLAILLSLMLLMSALMVPINISAEGIDWSAELEDRYDFDFTNEFYFSGDQHTDSQISNDNCYYDISKPWVYGSTTIDAGFNRGNRIIYPAYSAVEKSNNWGPQSFFQPGSVTYNDETVTTLQVTSLNPSFFMPLKEDGTPFELAPEHTYTVKIAYQVTATASSNNGGKLYFCAGIPSNGDMNSTNLCYTSTQSGNEIASWMAGNNYTYTATKEISTIGMSSDSNYNSNDNT